MTRFTDRPGRLTRRRFFQAGAGLATGATALSARTSEAADNDAAMLQRLTAKDRDPNRGILLKGGTIVSLDRQVGNLARGDVLVRGRKIEAIGANLDAARADVIEAANSIVIPGFVDAHRHSWEGQLRRINPNSPSLADYYKATHASFAQHYRPQDIYAGNLLTALGCIDSGITCVIDNSHNSRTPAHSDAAVEALMESGIRAVHASGAPQAGEWDKHWPNDLSRLQKKYFNSDDQLVTLGMFARLVREYWETARKLGLRIYTEMSGQRGGAALAEFGQQKLLGPDNTFNHCGDLPEAAWQAIKQAGAQVNVCPRSDSQYGLGYGFPAYQTAIDHGIKPGFSVDNETSYGTDMFMEMRVAFHMQRAVVMDRGRRREPKPAVATLHDMLECATVNGAACAGLSSKIGTLAPGKEADLVVIRTDAINLYPSNNAIGTVVAAAERSNVDTVMIGGKLRKFHGELIGLDMPRLMRLVDESREHLFARTGYKPDIFATSFSI
jgi:cytosine/adenosine deaminase-related metal-dependent hydrolase